MKKILTLITLSLFLLFPVGCNGNGGLGKEGMDLDKPLYCYMEFKIQSKIPVDYTISDYEGETLYNINYDVGDLHGNNVKVYTGIAKIASDGTRYFPEDAPSKQFRDNEDIVIDFPITYNDGRDFITDVYFKEVNPRRGYIKGSDTEKMYYIDKSKAIDGVVYIDGDPSTKEIDPIIIENEPKTCTIRIFTKGQDNYGLYTTKPISSIGVPANSLIQVKAPSNNLILFTDFICDQNYIVRNMNDGKEVLVPIADDKSGFMINDVASKTYEFERDDFELKGN